VSQHAWLIQSPLKNFFHKSQSPWSAWSSASTQCLGTVELNNSRWETVSSLFMHMFVASMIWGNFYWPTLRDTMGPMTFQTFALAHACHLVDSIHFSFLNFFKVLAFKSLLGAPIICEISG
jgi:hypothetical protein